MRYTLSIIKQGIRLSYMFSKVNRIRKLRAKLKPKKQLILLDEKERALVDVGAENYNDIFSPFCLYDMNVIDFELEQYLDARNESVPFEYDLSLVFHIKEANEQKRKEIDTTIKQSYGSRLQSVKKKLKQNKTSALIFLIVGLILLSIKTTFLLSSTAYVQSLMDILAWVFVWTSVEAYFLERSLLKIEQMLLLRMVTAKVEVHDFVPKWARQTPPPTEEDEHTVVV